jgi:DNA repair exonuclease SbcCD ATPase subunit
MFKTKVGMIGAVALVSIAGLATIQHQLRLREENESLRQELAQVSRLSADSKRLSNLVAQAKVAQASANDQFQELLRLRREVSRLSQEREESNRVNQAKMVQSVSDQLRELSALRSQVSGLSEEISGLREAIQELYASSSTSSSEERSTESTRSGEDRAMSVRIINTRGETFAEKLKRSAAAQEGETFQEVFGRFLQGRGIDLNNVAGLAFEERTGRVMVRATQATLDLIEKLTVALDGTQ